MKLSNKGALPTKIYVKTKDGKTIPFVSNEDLKAKEHRREQDRLAIKEEKRKAELAAAEEAAKRATEAAENEEPNEENKENLV